MIIHRWKELQSRMLRVLYPLRGTIVNGKKEGAWTEFNANGSVKSVMPFVDGKKRGLLH